MFRTELTIAPQERLLPRTARVLTVGSCFADSIGERLRLNKVNALVNPFGTVFQPLALAQLLRAAAGEEQDWQQHVVEARGRWQSYDFHSTIGAETAAFHQARRAGRAFPQEPAPPVESCTGRENEQHATSGGAHVRTATAARTGSAASRSPARSRTTTAIGCSIS